MTTLRQDPIFLCAVLLVGAALLTRRTTAKAAVVGRPPLGTGSMPGSAGTGNMQVPGGLIGSVMAGLFGTGGMSPSVAAASSSYASPWDLQSQINDSVLQNSVLYANNPELVDNITQYGV